MGAIGTLTCPECGHAARSERHLHRTRRRRVPAALALGLVLLGVQLAEQPRRAGERWTRAIPSTLLVFATHNEPDPAWFDALPEWRRTLITAAYSRPMWSWQRAIVETIDLHLTQDDVHTMFVNRWAWPVGERATVRVLVSEEACGYRSRSVCVTSTANLGTVHQIQQGSPGWAIYWSDGPGGDAYAFDLPPRPIGEYTDAYSVVVRNADGWTLGSWDVEFTTRVVGAPEEALPSVDTPEERNRITIAITLGIWEMGDERRLELRVDHHALLADFGVFPLRAEAVVDGERRYPFGPRQWNSNWNHDGEITLPADITDNRVVIRIWSDRAEAYAGGRAKIYWFGTLEIPLANMRRHPMPEMLN